MPVRILEDHVVNQIAAGEVVERPASVLRELLQNALDAGAGAIQIALRNGGMGLIRVADDGSGMNRTDAMMALERHATSKIHRAEDLQHVATLGFRGEALPSIAAVSRFELRTRLHDEEVGTRVRVEGGTLQDVSDAGCAPGTEIDVRALFFNLPARRKFLRTRTTELNHCIAAVTREVLLRPELDVVLSHEDREILRAPRAAGAPERVAAVLGEGSQGMIPTDSGPGAARVVGLLSPVGVHRSTAASSVFLYVNGRYVQDPLLRRAIYEAYRGLIPRGRYPLVVLDVQVDPLHVDVNVHPTKTEVRFTHPREVAETVSAAVRAVVDRAGAGPIRTDPTLATARPGPLFAPASEPLPLGSAAPPQRVAQPGPSLAPHPDDDPRLPAAPEPALPVPPPPDVVADRSPAERARWRGLEILAPFAEQHLLCSDGPTLVLIDLRQAHRALWSALGRAGELPLGPARRLLAPARVQLSRVQADRVEAAAGELERLGVLVDRFSPLEVAIRGLPQQLGPVPPDRLLQSLADVAESDGPHGLGDLLARVAAAHHELSREPVALRTLLACLDESGVPLGPPISGSFSIEELARRVRGLR